MPTGFKKVPALYKCFSILDLFARQKKALSIADITNKLNYNKSTVFNIAYTLTDLGILERENGKFRFGPKIYVLAKAVAKGSELIQIIHPYLVEISRRTKLTTFLGMRSGDKAVILDRAESSFDLKIYSEIGIRIPLLAGAHGKALLSLKTNDEINHIVDNAELKQFTRFSCMDKEQYKELIKKVRVDGYAVEREEYIEGIRALAVPLRIQRRDLDMAIWVVGLKSQIKIDKIPSLSKILIKTCENIEEAFSF